MIFPPPPPLLSPASRSPVRDDRFLAACSARPKYRLIVFEAEISLGWGRRVAEEEEEEEEG